MEPTSTSALERRLAIIEDKLAIYELIASHPLSADTGHGPFFPHVYTEDAVFDRGTAAPGAVGRDALVALVESEAHKQALDGGLAHFGNLPRIELDGDTAFVTSYLMLVRFDRDSPEAELPNHGLSRGHRIFRVLANRWTVVRTAEGWRVKTRKLFPMDGSAPARGLLHEALPE
ncbi:nuclear transport factor 2 family protein [Burkholderia gladioli]|uniref:nuclear transport factor 2 family protein n=1 Tax=Burkholderia gladioli TaxID=28095 RepID=UPI000CFFBD7D|nr:nuclear transport factor 2 family protein [Burkholderia gladioli]MBU9274080.1 nuclear transport factor 2 family protein [Burkholderia gladioli]MDN7748664.1 nuclear transport factor 2 family protein [Burkholderia gladioli]PRE20046.1 nuclear transport factor 2 family protein [Burkholderia gladioli]